MEKGQMRFDASVSIRPKGETKLYPRAEIKNLNSFRSLEAAIDYEIARQIKSWESGTPQSMEQTVGWDEATGETYLLRDKENAADYRYFPEPDIPPLEITDEMLNEWRKEVPESPMIIIARFQEIYGLSEAEAKFFSEDAKIAKMFEEVSIATGNPHSSASFIGTVLVNRLKESGKTLSESAINASHIIELIKLVDSGKISNNVAKGELFAEMLLSGKMPGKIMEEKGMTQVSGEEEIEALCKTAIEENPTATADVKAGKTKAIATIIGSVMKASKGRANPKMVNAILEKLLI
jgi:aspartyl-tRNA(Asn)/glutamyl-tRNA(Gln) amidotransferase subunit B